MSRTFEESVPVLKVWFESGQSGMLLFHKAPDSHSEQWLEQYVKREDIDDVLAKAADYILAKTGAFKVEISSAEGKMKKLKLTRRL